MALIWSSELFRSKSTPLGYKEEPESALCAAARRQPPAPALALALSRSCSVQWAPGALLCALVRPMLMVDFWVSACHGSASWPRGTSSGLLPLPRVLHLWAQCWAGAVSPRSGAWVDSCRLWLLKMAYPGPACRSVPQLWGCMALHERLWASSVNMGDAWDAAGPSSFGSALCMGAEIWIRDQLHPLFWGASSLG